jgi:chemotaxis protein histidine kinase CheA
MLRFHLRNPDRSLLVWDAEVQSQPSTLIQRIERNWQIPLDTALAHAQGLGQPTALLQHIALRILSDHPQTAPIDHELQSLIGPLPWPMPSEQIETSDLIEIYGHLQERTDLQAQLQQAQQNIDDINELRTQDLEKTKEEIAAKQDALNKLAAEQKVSAALITLKDELSAAQQLTLAKNKDLQEALDKQVVLTKETQEKYNNETAAKQDALNKLGTEQKASAALKKQKDDLSAAQQEASAKNKELQEESDLLLAQLHQVQEELEKYYLQNKERQIEVQKLQDRWLRAVQSHPELQDFEVLELLSESSTELTAHWRINQLLVGGVMKGPFEFKTVIENGVTGLTFTKSSKGLSLIHRWPLIAAKESQLTIIPVKGKDDPQKRSATLLQLGTSDWQLVRQLTDKLVKTVGSTAMAKQISHGPALLEGLKTQQQILGKVPALLRFDDIQLFGQQNTDQKSVIGLRLTHADLQGLKANPFEFQVQLNLAAGSDMTSAHLIFDEKTAGTPFENWTHNVKSSAGQSVMAVQLGPKGWNPQTWHALSPLDQQWLQNTVRLLPFMLATLQNQGVKLEKGWTTWVQAATEMIHWSKLPVDLTHATNSIQEAVPSKLLPPDAAPTATKAPPKSKQAVAKSAKSAKTPKTAVTKKPAVTNKPAVTVKKATKTARSSSPRTAVVPKAKRRTP